MDAIERIVAAGKARGWSQAEIEARLEWAQGRLSKLKGRVDERAKWAEMVALAREVGVSLDELAGLGTPQAPLTQDEQIVLDAWRESRLTPAEMVGLLMRLVRAVEPGYHELGSYLRRDRNSAVEPQGPDESGAPSDDPPRPVRRR